MAASMPPHGPAIGEDTTPDSWLVVLSKSKGHRIASLLVACHIHAHRPLRLVLARPPSRDPWRHGCRQGATWMYLQRVLRWWAGKGPATKPQMISSAPDLSGSSNQIATPASRVSRSFGDLQAGRGRGALTARGTRRKPVHGGSVAASMPPHGPAIGEDTTPDTWLAVFVEKPGGFVEKQRHRVARFAGALLKALQTDHLHRSLPAHHRGTLGGMDAATELHGCTCSVSCDGGRARALQQGRRWSALRLICP
ncbi:hypothetical protein FHT10_002794 [Xanthomonas arboricola]|nr:hypothetical protein [Xanthomonas cannabis]